MSFELDIQRALDQKTKPPGSLGRLEALAADLARIQRTLTPKVSRPHVVLFAADHGISSKNVSAYPREVTAQMVANFARGGAAICVLARAAGAGLEVIDVGVDADTSTLPGVVQDKLRQGSGDLSDCAALSTVELEHALKAGERAYQRARAAGCDLLALGEMGIGNTTVAAALLSALLHEPALKTTGAGSGVAGRALRHKREIISGALKRTATANHTPKELLGELGGSEIAALVGLILAAREGAIPLLVDGFIVTVAALCACRIDPAARRTLIFAHRSHERGHKLALQALAAEPLLDWQMRLGEASGAALAIPLCRAAACVLSEMATFASAAVSDRHA